MPIVWPPSLPQGPEFGWVEKKLDNRVTTKTDAGPAKRRRRFTRAVRALSLSFLMTSAERATFDDFHTNTLLDGTLEFDFVHPGTGLTTASYFHDMPNYSEGARGLHRVSFELRYTA